MASPKRILDDMFSVFWTYQCLWLLFYIRPYKDLLERWINDSGGRWLGVLVTLEFLPVVFLLLGFLYTRRHTQDRFLRLFGIAGNLLAAFVVVVNVVPDRIGVCARLF